jgi:hypothetical protein
MTAPNAAFDNKARSVINPGRYAGFMRQIISLAENCRQRVVMIVEQGEGSSDIQCRRQPPEFNLRLTQDHHPSTRRFPGAAQSLLRFLQYESCG